MLIPANSPTPHTMETSVYAHTEIEMLQRQMAYNTVVNTARRTTDKPIPGNAYWDFSNQGLRLKGHLHVPRALTHGWSHRILSIAQITT
jgi:hypothetical protein